MMTIGHSTLPLEVFVQALKDNGCQLLIDVRSIPRSRHNPQFEQPTLFAALEAAGICRRLEKGTGRPHGIPAKTASTLAGETRAFAAMPTTCKRRSSLVQIDWLMALPNLDATTVMCAEAVPWRCHRSLIGDAVLARGGSVEDIFVPATGKSFRKPHELTKFARIEGQRVWYPAPEDETNPRLFD